MDGLYEVVLYNLGNMVHVWTEKAMLIAMRMTEDSQFVRRVQTNDSRTVLFEGKPHFLSCPAKIHLLTFYTQYVKSKFPSVELLPLSFLTLAKYLCHFLKVDEVAEAEWCQVKAGLLAVVGVFNGYCHFDVIRRPGSSVILPFPLPALARGRGRVIEAPSNWTDGSFHGRVKRNVEMSHERTRTDGLGLWF